MKKNQIRIFALEVILIVILFFVLFASNIITRGLLATIVSIYALIVVYILKIRKISSINKKQMMILMMIFSMFYLAIFYLLGLYFG